MKKLLIVAHPSDAGHAVRHANVYEQEAISSGHEVDRVDLYAPENRQDYLVLPPATLSQDQQAIQQAMQAKISWADEIVFLFPIWRFDCPAILKNRFDVNFAAGFSHKYKKNSLMPHQLLKGKTARVIATAGGPSWLYYTLGGTLFVNFALGRLRYCGIRIRSYTVFGNVHHHHSEEEEQAMDNRVKKLAKT